MTWTSWVLRGLDHAAGARTVDRVEHDDAGALGDGGVDLLGLLGLVLVGVVVDDLAVGAELGDLGLEERLVEGLVAGGLGLGEQQGDDLAVAAAVAGVAADWSSLAPQAVRPRRRRAGQRRRRRCGGRCGTWVSSMQGSSGGEPVVTSVSSVLSHTLVVKS